MLLYWRPTDAGPYEGQFDRLEAEVADLAARVDDQPVTLSGRSTSALLREWSASDSPVWLKEHAATLQARCRRALPANTGGGRGHAVRRSRWACSAAAQRSLRAGGLAGTGTLMGMLNV